MIRAKVLHEFRDANDFTKRYEVGSVHEFNYERAKKLADLNLVEFIKLNDQDFEEEADIEVQKRTRRRLK